MLQAELTLVEIERRSIAAEGALMSNTFSRRSVLKGTAAVAAGSLAGLRLFDAVAPAAASSASSRSAERQPNILFIIVDETRFPSVFPAGINT
ncbi:MAG: hypothetical protein F2847_01425, partial [Actinobacteria bacterium]|nr:hypothetical protein [Actinomycetota bacterium]